VRIKALNGEGSGRGGEDRCLLGELNRGEETNTSIGVERGGRGRIKEHRNDPKGRGKIHGELDEKKKKGSGGRRFEERKEGVIEGGRILPTVFVA